MLNPDPRMFAQEQFIYPVIPEDRSVFSQPAWLLPSSREPSFPVQNAS
jgi:hypothetical protein